LGTPSNRLLFQLVPQAMRPTEGTEFGLLLKTPTVMDGEVTSGKKNPTSGNSGTLAQEIMSQYKPTMLKIGMLPTPAARDVKGTNSMEHLRGENGTVMNHIGQLPNFIKYHTGTTSQLSPLFVEEMMGFPKNWTVLPFQNGEENQ